MYLSVAEPYHFDASPGRGRKNDVASAPIRKNYATSALAPFLLFIREKISFLV
jgi:hypothetical protein